jgi:hypothetical protein
MEERSWPLVAQGVCLRGNQTERAARTDRQRHCLYLPRCGLENGLEQTENSHTGQHDQNDNPWQVGRENCRRKRGIGGSSLPVPRSGGGLDRGLSRFPANFPAFHRYVGGLIPKKHPPASIVAMKGFPLGFSCFPPGVTYGFLASNLASAAQLAPAAAEAVKGASPA